MTTWPHVCEQSAISPSRSFVKPEAASQPVPGQLVPGLSLTAESTTARATDQDVRTCASRHQRFYFLLVIAFLAGFGER